MGESFTILVSDEVRAFIDSLDDKSERIVKENLAKLESPFPDTGPGDKEKITWRGEEVYRLHIGRTWTAFYDIHIDPSEVKVLKILPIDKAHKEYGSL